VVGYLIWRFPVKGEIPVTNGSGCITGSEKRRAPGELGFGIWVSMSVDGVLSGGAPESRYLFGRPEIGGKRSPPSLTSYNSC
jgi:hypothetical protein